MLLTGRVILIGLNGQPFLHMESSFNISMVGVSTVCELCMHENVCHLGQLATATPLVQTTCHDLSFMSQSESEGLNHI